MALIAAITSCTYLHCEENARAALPIWMTHYFPIAIWTREVQVEETQRIPSPFQVYGMKGTHSLVRNGYASMLSADPYDESDDAIVKYG